jgi:hypothetical protein
MRLSQRTVLILFSLFVVLILGFVCYLGYALFIQEQYVVTTLEAGPNRRIKILADTFYDNGQHFDYTVEVNNGVVVPRHIIGGGADHGTLVFSLVYSKDRNLVAVIEGSNPNIIYVLHDFSSGETWPGGNGKNSQMGIRLRDRLREDTRNYDLELSDNVPGNVPRKLG